MAERIFRRKSGGIILILHEFAVEPEALSDWQIFKYVMEKFSLSQGRVICRFPTRWESKVLKTLRKKLDDVAYKRAELFLIRSENKRFVNSNRLFEGGISWVEKAVYYQHSNHPFHKIISATFYQHNDVIFIKDITEDIDEIYLKVPREERIQKNVIQLADNTELLLAHCREILFVDPNFDPKKPKWWKPLSEILNRLKNKKRELLRIEYHVNYESGASSKGDNLSQYQEGKKYIPQGYTVLFIRWSDKYTPRFHGRYILTEFGGIRSEYGLDIDVGESHTTDLSMLDEKIYDETWKMFQRETPVYEYVDQTKVIGEGPI